MRLCDGDRRNCGIMPSNVDCGEIFARGPSGVSVGGEGSSFQLGLLHRP